MHQCVCQGWTWMWGEAFQDVRQTQGHLGGEMCSRRALSLQAVRLMLAL